MADIGHVLTADLEYQAFRMKTRKRTRMKMSDFVHIMPGQVSVICPNINCKQLAVTGSHSYYKCSYCGTKFQVKKCIYRGRNYRDEVTP